MHHREHNHDNIPPDGSNSELLCLYCHHNEHQRQLEAAQGASGPRERGQPSTYSPFADLKARLEKKQSGK